jgi:hypothetical protein
MEVLSPHFASMVLTVALVLVEAGSSSKLIDVHGVGVL